MPRPPRRRTAISFAAELERLKAQGGDVEDFERAMGRRASPSGSSATATARWSRPSRRCSKSACPASSAPPSRWAAPAAASPITARNSSTSSRRGLDASPTAEVLIEESVLGWKEYEMEVVRDKRRQLHHHLLDRECRSDGRAYRRFDHRRPGADPDRQGISDHAQRLDRGAARDRRRDRRLERAVRRQSRRTAASSSSR